ncbi:hypothetical protein EZS27_035394 [termite gut metagenome]|uniref:IPT/TIG domain-containing protein n=1 Tax=termite gut metagenome TaxID=433724 RepID=A0A5J4PWP6_9ZZZZ
MKTTIRLRYASILWCLATLMFLLACCSDEKEFSADYDIEWPVSSIDRIEPINQKVGETIEVTGKNLQHTVSFYIGSISCKIITKSENKLIVEVPLTVAERSSISITNLYNRKFNFSELFIPILP